MNIELLSTIYTVRKIEEEDIHTVFQLCEKNPQFYEYCPPFVTLDGIREDLKALPKGKTMEDKYYVGFYNNEKLVAVMDLISQYPNDKTAFIGFFMMDIAFQGQGIGSKIIHEVCTYLKQDFDYIRLAYVKGNNQSKNFWYKNNFKPTGVEVETDAYVMVVMQKSINEDIQL